MATFKATVRGERKDGFLQVYIRMTHNKRHGYIKTDKMVTAQQFDKHGDICFYPANQLFLLCKIYQ